jgi:hypothetical protein
MEIYKKLHEAKKEIGKITKDSKNPFFKSNYLSLNGLIDAIEPTLEKHGLLLLQPIEAEWVKTKIFDIETGESVSSEIHLGTMTDPQKMGSAITYYRRYTLQSLLGLQAEDDDANKASAPAKKEDDDQRPWLTDEGLKYLEEKGTKADIETAFAERRMKKVYRERLDLKLKKL